MRVKSSGRPLQATKSHILFKQENKFAKLMSVKLIKSPKNLTQNA